MATADSSLRAELPELGIRSVTMRRGILINANGRNNLQHRSKKRTQTNADMLISLRALFPKEDLAGVMIRNIHRFFTHAPMNVNQISSSTDFISPVMHRGERANTK
jgi:hypothetical protein